MSVPVTDPKAHDPQAQQREYRDLIADCSHDHMDWQERPTEDSFGTDDDGYSARWELPPDVRSALDKLTAAFAGARLSDDFEACPHCFTAHDIAYLRTVSPFEMTNSDIGLIAARLTTTIGSPCDIAYFVPAMVRAQFRGIPLEDASVMKQLGRITASDWTAQRREALRLAYQAYFAWRPADNTDLDEPGYRAWISVMLDRPPHSEAVERPIPGWDQ